MSGINAGVLSNAYPLTPPQIAQLEKDVIENNAVYAYLDDTGDLCFAMQHGVNGIRDLAWHNAYELKQELDGSFSKNAFKKSGLKTYDLDKIYTKTQLDGSWVAAGDVFEFDGDFSKYPTFDLGSDEFTVAKLVRVSDRVFSMQELSSSTVTGYFGGPDGLQSVDGSVLTPLEDYDPYVDVTLRWLSADPDGEPPVVGVCENYSNNEACPATGTYFLYVSQNETFDHSNPLYKVLYTKSISCLTTADALQPTERLEGDGQEFYTAAPSTLAFRSTAPLNEFQDVQINGQTVDPSNYTLEEGSTIVKLKHDYLSTLNAGQYEVSVVSNNKIVSGGFTVNVPELNEYGFYYNQPYSISLTEHVEDSEESISYVISIFSINSDNTVLRFDPSNGERLDAAFELEGRHFKLQFEQYEIIGVFSADGSVAVESFNVLGEPVDNVAITIKVDNELACADKYYYYIRKEGTFEEWIVAPKASNETWYPKIPSTIKDMPVTFLAECSFRENTSITSLEMISDNINTFGSLAFYGCSSITSLYIPDHVSDFWSQCFGNCTALQSIALPAGLSALEDYLFSGCTNLREIIYRGTKAECEQLLENWRAGFTPDVFSNVPATHILCSDGQVAL